MTLGKFAPLHKGHQCLIEHALGASDDLIVIVYDAPEVTTIPLPIRAGWIRALYPTVEVLEAWNGPTVVGDTPEIRKIHENFLIEFLAGRRITHFFSSEFYGQHVSTALGAEDCRFDEARSASPISGTAVRANPFANRHYLHPLVYRDLVAKVVFLGAPSTGKTTLAEAAARHMNTLWMPEYGREYWERHQVDRRLTLEQLLEIAEEHVRREDALALNADRYLFVDTDATTTFMFSQMYHGQVHPRLADLAAATRDRYDLFFLCEDDIPYDATEDRSGEVSRSIMQKRIKADCFQRRIPFITLSGSLPARLEQVMAVLERFDRFRSFGDQYCA